MVEKNKILESWIMVEHLSEGNIKSNDKSFRIFDPPEKDDYFSLLTEEMKKSKVCQGPKGGIAFYFDIFNFDEVVSFLREQYKLHQTDEEANNAAEERNNGEKFSFVIYFDKNLNFLKDMTFFTASAYIRYFKKVPLEAEFAEFEERLKKQFEQDFDEADMNADKFNAVILKILKEYDIDTKKCRLHLINNIDKDSTNLHSFFIDDLEYAKNIDTPNLNEYLYGDLNGRVNLDSKKDSANFNPTAFEDILQPKNYPLGRFPEKTEYALSLMQQVAVNLATGYDNKAIRSVNGPPGTGKTTLLKDIFAELIVEQAYDITKMSERQIRGTKETVYFDKASIGVLPEEISQNGIVVASSNNGAVQNIVNELPLIEKIDPQFTDELLEADYFCNIANSDVSFQWENDKNGKPQKELEIKPNKENKFWGLFSLEGGKSNNIDGIIARIEAVIDFFDEYKSDETIYSEFLNQYNIVKNICEKAQKSADNYNKLFKPRYVNLIRNTAKLLKDYDDKKQNCDENIHKLTSKLESINKEISENKVQISELGSEILELNDLISSWDSQIESLKNNMTGQFISINEKMLESIKSDRSKTVNRINELKEKVSFLETNTRELQNNSEALSNELNNVNIEQKNIIARKKECNDYFEQTKALLEVDKNIKKINALDMYMDYDELHLSNPWFDENYRIEQSKLFILALKVRKQFLYENRKNVKAANIIWKQQNKYLDNKKIIAAAWDWINMTIPVISSTFASFSRMCKNLEINTIGHLFVDEAGQAIPQASVGAIFRSRNVMVVGDPSQIKPVLTLDPNVLSILSKHFGVTEKYLSESASTQTLVDSASGFGFYKEPDRSEDSWIGIPLWVHRRCQYPMFTISNQISYNGFMVQGKCEYGKANWYDIGGKADNKYVKEQGEFLAQIISQMAKDDPSILENNPKDTIYVITPFSNVAFCLAEKLRKINFTRYDNNRKPTNIGTIHTFQGKEAPIVFMVLGADSQSTGAASWAFKEPNMMNVAATRAKEKFYVIGDKKLYLKSKVASETYRIIEEYLKDHPDPLESNARSIIKQITKDDRSQTSSETRICGKITRVGNGQKNKYAYIKGNDGENYTINETIYSQTENADQIIQKNKSVSFIPENRNNYILATNIKPI